MLTDVYKAKLEEFRAETSEKSEAGTRLSLLFDGGVFNRLYAGEKNGESPAGVIAAYGYVDGSPVYAFSQDKNIKGGAVSLAHASKICRVYELASKNGLPVVGIFDSNGAFIEQGASVIGAYGEMLMHTGNLSGVVPQISVICGVCSGSSALIACSADFVIATQNSELYINPSEKNPSDIISVNAKDDSEALSTARKLISTLPANNISPAPEFEFEYNNADAEGDAYQIAAAVADTGSVIELNGDSGSASYTAVARIGGSAAGIISTNKSGDRLSSEDASKLARFVRICDAFSIPIVTFIDTEGFDPDCDIREIVRLAGAYTEATTLKIAVFTGRAYGSAAVVFNAGNSDIVYSYADAVISPIDPVTAVEFLMHDRLKGAKDLAAERNRLALEYSENRASAFNAAGMGFVTEIITSGEARDKLISVLEVMSGKRLNKRLPKKHGNY